MGLTKGDTRSLDNGSHVKRVVANMELLCCRMTIVSRRQLCLTLYLTWEAV